MKDSKVCKYCGVHVKKDWIALNMKLLNPENELYLCLSCLAQEFDCTVEDLEIKIVEFKESGCMFFK